MSRVSNALWLAAAGLLAAGCSLPVGTARHWLAVGGSARATIVVGAAPTRAEQTAASELAAYLARITGATFAVVQEDQVPERGIRIFVGHTAFARERVTDPAKLGAEEWLMHSVDDDLVLTGGRPRGTLYAVYRFLEDVVGVHWWNPWEEHVPRARTLTVPLLARRGKPVLRYRDIYMLYGGDRGRCAARNRLNRDGDAGIAAEYGGEMDYGPPYHVHTFYLYVPPKAHFEQHPEWFSLIGGKRDATRKQLCLTNPELRKFMVGRLRAYIEQARAQAQKQGTPPPTVFDISQNDWGGMCQCPKCQAIARAEGSEAGPLLDFVNHMADAIKDDYPDVFIDTLAYQMTQQAPKTLHARDNVIVRLCDTASNFTKPITHAENAAFRDHLLAWSAKCRNLRIWDYAVTYAPYYGLPLPTVHTYPVDYQFYHQHHVEGVFTEHEYPVLADMRDLKVWMMMKLLEDPYRDYDELLATFTDGFYGSAGWLVRRYLARLEAASARKSSHLSMGASPRQYRYLDLAFVREAQAIFDQAERAVGGDPTLLRRVRHARLPLDRATIVLYKRMAREWRGDGGNLEAMPIDRKAVAERARATWHEQIALRIPKARQAAERAKADAEIDFLLARPAWVPPPAKFRDVPADRLFDFTADESRNWKDIVKRVPDPEAESGITNRLELDADLFRDPKADRGRSYKLPMPWGLYNVAAKDFARKGVIKPEDVPGPGYHWYKMGTFQVRPTDYLYFFWSWIIQVDVDSAADPAHPDQRFDVWARIKFEGPGFPHGKPGDRNAICVERVVLVKAEEERAEARAIVEDASDRYLPVPDGFGIGEWGMMQAFGLGVADDETSQELQTDFCRGLLVLERLENVLRRPAVRADPVVGQGLEGGPRRDVIVGIALGGVVDIAARHALVLLQRSLLSGARRHGGNGPAGHWTCLRVSRKSSAPVFSLIRRRLSSVPFESKKM